MSVDDTTDAADVSVAVTVVRQVRYRSSSSAGEMISTRTGFEGCRPRGDSGASICLDNAWLDSVGDGSGSPGTQNWSGNLRGGGEQVISERSRYERMHCSKSYTDTASNTEGVGTAVGAFSAEEEVNDEVEATEVEAPLCHTTTRGLRSGEVEV